MEKQLVQLLNTQINKEFYSAYLYQEFAKYFYNEGLEGFSNWYDVQSMEEIEHGMRILKFMQRNKIEYHLSDIVAPHLEFVGVLDALQKGLNHEKYVTDLITTIYHDAVKFKDSDVVNLIDWFVEEQKEEESNALELIEKYRDSEDEIKKVDVELLKRSYNLTKI